MRRPLSSPLTFFWKFVIPTLFVAGAGYVVLVQCLDTFRNRDGAPLSYGELCLSLAVWAAALAWVIGWTSRLKRVEVDDHALYVSNYRSEIRIPLTDVCEVDETSGDRRYFTVRVDLRKKYAFGQRIVFRPRFRLYWSGLHPVTRELHALCKRARGDQGADRAN